MQNAGDVDLLSTIFALRLSVTEATRGKVLATNVAVARIPLANTDASQWAPLPADRNAPTFNAGTIHDIATVSIGGVDRLCIAGGFEFTDSIDNIRARYRNQRPNNLHGIACTQGAAWGPLGDSSRMLHGAVVRSIDQSSGIIVAGGDFDFSDGRTDSSNLQNIARFSASSEKWTPLGMGAGRGVRSVAVDNVGRVYIAGNISVAGCVGVERMAFWESERRWMPIPTGGRDSPIHTLLLVPTPYPLAVLPRNPPTLGMSQFVIITGFLSSLFASKPNHGDSIASQYEVLVGNTPAQRPRGMSWKMPGRIRPWHALCHMAVDK